MNQDLAKVQFRTSSEAGLAATSAQNSAAVPQEFASVEDMLRYDATLHPPPPELAERINESLAGAEPAPKPSWFQRWLGGGDKT